jgi:D-alanyl-lipoteichoic acid acyltransferase DltB (MBOAT superfamily)
MARRDTAWFRVVVIFLSLALWMGLPLAFLIWRTTEKKLLKQEAVIEQQNRKIAKLERKLNKDEE